MTNIISSAVNDEEFMNIFRLAIDVELDNLSELREKASLFPIEDIGVAQGNSLSPLLGNIILSSFDTVMNEGDCRCIRYIDDFIILAPTAKAANARLRKAKALLLELGMELSPEKSDKGASPIEIGFDFLGIHICPGLIRPSEKSQIRLLAAVDNAFLAGKKAMIGARSGNVEYRSNSLLSTLKLIEGTVQGWGKHYWFCNDTQTFSNIDLKISKILNDLISVYQDLRSSTNSKHHAALLGIYELSNNQRNPFSYPSKADKRSC